MPRLKKFLLSHPSTIYAVVEAEDAFFARMQAFSDDTIKWEPSDQIDLDLDELEAEEIE